jgi:hypothetical protein
MAPSRFLLSNKCITGRRFRGNFDFIDYSRRKRMTHTNQVHAEATVQCERADAHALACEQAQTLGATMRPLKEQELRAIAGGPTIQNID